MDMMAKFDRFYKIRKSDEIEKRLTLMNKLFGAKDTDMLFDFSYRTAIHDCIDFEKKA